ncbi:MAG: ribosomal protein S18-alanine N-acetyltransferase [Lachnospiraceae bacterium]|nr:ribosomal protein S18-alanine N-acetyltransferase [Lachnospiraceae bacterium]
MIRRMEPRDLEEVAGLEQVCFTENWSYRLLEAGIHSPYDLYFVWEQEGRVWGYCCLRLLAGEGEIQRIAVLPEYRRLGVGRKMMEAMVNHAIRDRAYAISLEVRAGNLAARKLYESFGFAAEAVRKGYYHNPPEDALIMWRRGL